MVLIELDGVLGMMRSEDLSSSRTVSTLIPVLDLWCSSRANNTFPVVPGSISSDGVSDGTRGMKDSEVSKVNVEGESGLFDSEFSAKSCDLWIGITWAHWLESNQGPSWSKARVYTRACPLQGCRAEPSPTKPKMSEELLERDAERDELRTNDGEIGFPIAVLG
jgi:hypothetical protein